jgi:hypothetical protein
MTVIASLSNRAFAVNEHVIPFSVAVNATRLQITLTHANTLAAWPAGSLYKFDWSFGGQSTGQNTGSGGIRNDKAGSPVAGNVATAFSAPKPLGVTSGIVTITVLQSLTTAALVESF